MNIEHIQKLANYQIVDHPFDYKDLDEELINKYQSFEQRFEELYLDKKERFKLKDCFFYIKNDISCNAFARNKRGYNIIGITSGYAIQMLDAFHEKYFSNTSILSLIDFNDINIVDGYNKLLEIHDFRVNEFMLECSTRFTFGHEFQHILQFNSSQIIIDNYISENLDSSNFDIKRHAWELDADFFAMWDVMIYILNVKNSYFFRDKESINSNAFICLLFLGIGSVCITKTLSYFGAWNFEKNIQKMEFYTKKYSHPHPLVRLLNIIDHFHEQVQDSFTNLRFDKQDLLNSILKILAVYFKSFAPNKRILADMFRDLDDHLNTANDYKNELYDVGINDESIQALLIKRGINFGD